MHFLQLFFKNPKFIESKKLSDIMFGNFFLMLHYIWFSHAISNFSQNKLKD